MELSIRLRNWAIYFGIPRSWQVTSSTFSVVETFGTGGSERIWMRCSADQEEILYQDILLDQVHEERMGNTVLIDRHPADYEPLIH